MTRYAIDHTDKLGWFVMKVRGGWYGYVDFHKAKAIVDARNAGAEAPSPEKPGLCPCQGGDRAWPTYPQYRWDERPADKHGREYARGSWSRIRRFECLACGASWTPADGWREKGIEDAAVSSGS